MSVQGTGHCSTGGRSNHLLEVLHVWDTAEVATWAFGHDPWLWQRHHQRPVWVMDSVRVLMLHCFAVSRSSTPIPVELPRTASQELCGSSLRHVIRSQRKSLTKGSGVPTGKSTGYTTPPNGQTSPANGYASSTSSGQTSPSREVPDMSLDNITKSLETASINGNGNGNGHILAASPAVRVA